MSLPALWKLEAEVAERAAEVQAVLDAGDEPTDEQLEALARVVALGRAKSDALGMFMVQLMADAEQCANLAARQRARSDRLVKLRKRLDDYVLRIMDQHEMKQLRGVHCTLRMQANPQSVNITNEDELPKSMFRQPPPYPDKAAIKAALERGDEVPGAQMVRGRHLRIDQ